MKRLSIFLSKNKFKNAVNDSSDSENKSDIKVMSDRMSDKWLKLYELLVNDRNFFSDKAWETLKFFTTIYLAILSITIGLVINLNDTTNEYEYDFIIVLLPIIAIAISLIGQLNFMRENTRVYETIASLKKLEKLLGFHEEIKEEDRIFKKDKYVLPNYFIEMNENKKIKSEDTKYFIDWMIERKPKFGYGKFYSILNYIFVIYILIAFVLFFIIIYFFLFRKPLQDVNIVVLYMRYI